VSAAAPAHRFGRSRPLSLGVEEELLLVGPDHRLRPDAERVREGIGPLLRDGVTTEIFAAEIELKTSVCEGPGRALEELTRLREAVRGTGLELIGSGLYPDVDPAAGVLVEKPRYEVVRDDLAGLLATPPAGLHVHVGMPDPETAIRVANAMRLHLPLLGALCANSPFHEGEDSGLASARAAVVRSYPRFEVPRAFADYEDFLAVADQLIAAAGVADYTYLWWDVRPHPRLGTVEVRGMDVQSAVAADVGIAALIQALAAKEIAEPSRAELAREAIEESYYQAERHGLRARLMVDGETAAPAYLIARRVLEEARPYARELGGEDALGEVERILREGNGADAQRRAFEAGGMQGLLADLLARTS
jgi:glutamate---cysteine ligase / carboxylate-amine ligase